MLAFIMLWAYMSFSQYLIIWSGNLTEEIPWYLRRSAGGWRCVALLLIAVPLLRAVLPAALRENKRRPERALADRAGLLLVMHFFNDVWLIVPAFPAATQLARRSWRRSCRRWSGIGGLWVAVFARFLAGPGPCCPRTTRSWKRSSHTGDGRTHEPGGGHLTMDTRTTSRSLR